MALAIGQPTRRSPQCIETARMPYASCSKSGTGGPSVPTMMRLAPGSLGALISRPTPQLHDQGPAEGVGRAEASGNR